MVQTPSFSFPTTKLRNITCVFCGHQYFVRVFIVDLSHLKGSYLPLLLNCGHASCNRCVLSHKRDPCKLCGPSLEPPSSQNDSLPPIDIYIIGLIGVNNARPAYGDKPDISFSQMLNARMKQRSIDHDHCYECGLRAVLRCHQCNTLFCVSRFNKRVRLVLQYVKAVESGELKGNHEVLRAASSLGHRLPVLDTPNFRADFYNQCNDFGLMTYLGIITKGCNDINQLVNKFNILYDKQCMGRRRRSFFF